MLNFFKILGSVLWLIKEEFLELTKNFSPLVLLFSLFSVCLYHIWHGENAWDSLLAVLIAMPFGLLFFYAAFTCIAVFYDKSMQKLRAAVLKEVRQKRRRKDYAQAAAFLKTARRQYFQVAFWSVLALILIGAVIVMIMAAQAGLTLYREILG